MDAIVIEKCRGCGKPLTERRKLKDFCTYSCRGQHSVNTLCETGLKRSKNTRKTKALRSLRKQSVGHFTFERINRATIRIDRQGKRSVGWLMDWSVNDSPERWVACVGDHRSKPLPLQQAKEAARALLTTRSKAEPRDFIQEHNQLAATEVDRAYWAKEKREWPLDLMGGQSYRAKKPSMTIEPELRRAILDIERILIDDDKPKSEPLQGNYPLEYYEDGYPKLPTCLDRREAAA